MENNDGLVQNSNAEPFDKENGQNRNVRSAKLSIK